MSNTAYLYTEGKTSLLRLYLLLSLFLRLAPFIRVATVVLSAQPIWQMFLYRMPFLSQPSPESALTRATPVLGLTQSFTHHNYSLQPVAFVQFTYMPCLWIVGETGAPGGNPRRHRENMQTPHRKASLLSRDSNQGPSYCEATVLPTEPP